MARTIKYVFMIVAIAGAPPTTSSVAQDVKVETALGGLDRPGGMAVRPGGSTERHEVFISETGAGRVIKVQSDRPGDSAVVINAFPSSAPKGTAIHAGGPLGLLFLNREHLVVGGSGGVPDVRRYELNNVGETLAADQVRERVALPTPANASETLYGGCYALARTRSNDEVPDVLLVGVVGDDRINGVWKIAVRAGTLADVSRFDSNKESAARPAPAAIAISEQGYAVIADMRALDTQRDSLITFQNPISGTLVMQLTTQLHDIVGLAYSPTSRNLYAIDLATAAPTEGGVFRIDDASQPGRAAAKAVRIATVRKPTALTFGPDGALYVTAWKDENGSTKQGELLRITGEL